MTPEHIAATSRQISLALVGAIILTSIRFVLRLVSRVRRSTPEPIFVTLHSSSMTGFKTYEPKLGRVFASPTPRPIDGEYLLCSINKVHLNFFIFEGHVSDLHARANAYGVPTKP